MVFLHLVKSTIGKIEKVETLQNDILSIACCTINSPSIKIVLKQYIFPNSMVTRRIPVKAINHYLHVVTSPYHLHNRSRLRGVADNLYGRQLSASDMANHSHALYTNRWGGGVCPHCTRSSWIWISDLRRDYWCLFIRLFDPETWTPELISFPWYTFPLRGPLFKMVARAYLVSATFPDFENGTIEFVTESYPRKCKNWKWLFFRVLWPLASALWAS